MTSVLAEEGAGRHLRSQDHPIDNLLKMIDELPGLTTPETTAVMLALCEALKMRIHFVAPAFGFQKNMPYADNTALRALIEKQWAVCRQFGASIGFHSGSGKSAENYQIMGEVTGGRLFTIEQMITEMGFDAVFA